jgi:hypothetical protein
MLHWEVNYRMSTDFTKGIYWKQFVLFPFSLLSLVVIFHRVNDFKEESTYKVTKIVTTNTVLPHIY